MEKELTGGTYSIRFEAVETAKDLILSSIEACEKSESGDLSPEYDNVQFSELRMSGVSGEEAFVITISSCLFSMSSTKVLKWAEELFADLPHCITIKNH